jgi:LysM repeat protein
MYPGKINVRHKTFFFIILILIIPFICANCASQKKTKAPKEVTISAPAPAENNAKGKKTTEQPKQEQKKHVVQQGESLSIIAKKYNVTVEALAKLNNITDVNFIVVGQELLIPEPGGK